MHGLIIINDTNMLAEVAQGIFRLRNINIGHTIDFYLCSSIDLGEEKLNNLYKKLKENDKQNKKNLKYKAKLQILKFYQRMYFKYITDKYKELVYYNTIKYLISGIENYYDEVDFNNTIIFNDFPKVNLKEFLGNKLHINIEIETEKQIETIIEKQTEKQNKNKTNYFQLVNINATIKDYLSFNILNYGTPSYDNHDILKFDNFNIILSYEIQQNLLLYFKNNKWITFVIE